jgi:Family of unknown function (DUF6130)
MNQQLIDSKEPPMPSPPPRWRQSWHQKSGGTDFGSRVQRLKRPAATSKTAMPALPGGARMRPTCPLKGQVMHQANHSRRRIGHIHITVDDVRWHFVDASAVVRWRESRASSR